ncbi:serine/threonine protein kinase [Cellulomonas fimi]|uniref:serine/threonine-protein kinase n=1 Tax=Cellulomonas fimi TaxID=1708 RepID=UPI00234C1A6A|nr:serine/threonine-protein kinase [Cellulomonas fimi]MDC7121109.1 serine/threonine protein kinase [Cellulomonas fimi]
MPPSVLGSTPTPSRGTGASAPPVVLGHRYRLDEVIGRGGAAVVHRATDELLHRVVAVKVLPPVPRDSDDLRRHEAEIRVLAGLRHPGLVRLFDADTVPVDGDDVQVHLVMELVPGPTLARRLADGPLTVRQTAAVGRAAAEALAVVHARGVIHRDVKPGNILLTSDDCLDLDELPDHPVKLVDFGIARLAAATRLTVTGMIVGTASYLSPEQAVGSTLAPSSDVYALGLVLLECVTGRPVFAGTMAEVAAARLSRDPDVPDDVDGHLADLLVRMTRRRPEDRPTADDVARELADVLDGRVAPAPPVGATLLLPAVRPADAGAIVDEPTMAADAAALGLPSDAMDRLPNDAAADPSGPRAGAPTEAADRPTTAEATVADGPGARVPGTPGAPAPTVAAPAGAPGSPVDRVRTAAATVVGRVTAVTHRVVERWGRVPVLAVAAALLVAVAVAVVLLVRPVSDPEPQTPPPAYPVVDGPLGDALVRLQQGVEP